MLTEKDLAIVRAALLYLDEEISPSGSDTLQYYLDDRGIVLGVTVADIKLAREAFENSVLFYAKKRRDLDQLESVELVSATGEDELIYMSDRTELASVLVAKR